MFRRLSRPADVTDRVEVEALRVWLGRRLAEVLGLEELPRDQGSLRFSDLGLDSARALALTSELSKRLGRRLPSTLFWDHVDLDTLCRTLGAPNEEATAIEPDRPPVVSESEPIAVVGMACHFAGGAVDLESFWQMLIEGRDAVGVAPSSRSSLVANPPLRGAFLDDIARFDPLFFGVSPEEAAQMDPQQRLMLELAFSAIEDAGVAPASLRGTRTGVYFGVIWNDYAVLKDRAGPEAMTRHTATGSHFSIVANRVSYALGLEGPSMAVDTACSASLVSVHLASRALLFGEADFALAGGVNLFAVPDSHFAMEAFGAMSAGGRVRAFDAGGDGYVRGEGAGVVALMPLSRAVEAGARVYCTIRGTAVNNDGYSNGLSAPSPRAQRRVIAAALEQAGLGPADIQYVEAHGTGTRIGDPIEASALGAVIGKRRDTPLRIGSVKTNIGHTEAAAGIAGFIKTALSLHHRHLPASLNFATPNPEIDFEDLNLSVQRASEPWPSCTVARAGVSSFGFGGTNAHVVLEEIPRSEEISPVDSGPADLVFCFSGQGGHWPGMARDLALSQPAFRAYLEACCEALERHTGWPVLPWITGAKDPGSRSEIVQPLTFAVQAALTGWLAHLGLEPAVVVGHSFGEVAAAYAAGALDLDDAARLVVIRSRLTARTPGRALFVPLDRAAVEEDLAARSDLYLATLNGPEASVVSGRTDAVERYLAELEARGLDAAFLPVDFPCHSPLLSGASDELARQLAGLRPRVPRISMVSTVTAESIETPPGPAYWAANLREPVRFADAVREVAARGLSRFVEIGPHPVLARFITACLEELGTTGSVSPTLARNAGGPEHVAKMCRDAKARRVPEARTKYVVPISAHLPEARTEYLVPISAHLPEAAKTACRQMADLLRRRTDVPVRDLAYTAARCRSLHPYRFAVTAGDRSALARRLDEAASFGSPRRARQAPIVFVFPGQGSQWPGMGRVLMKEEPAFREALETCDAAINREVGWSVIEELKRDAGDTRLGEVDYIQPAIFAVQVGLCSLLSHWGIRPDAVVGHSMGEVAAAYVAGMLTLQDAVRVICTRSRIARRASRRGRMALVQLSAESAARALERYGAAIAVAAHNGPSTVLIAGDEDPVEDAVETLSARGVFARLVQVDYASHCRHVDRLLPELERALGRIEFREPTVPFHSTVEGFGVNPSVATSYWLANLRRPVRFFDVVARLAGGGHGAFAEISPHPVLVHAIEDTIRDGAWEAVAIPTLRRDAGRDALLDTAAALYEVGRDPDWRRLFPACGNVVSLPSFPFSRKRYWIGESLPDVSPPDTSDAEAYSAAALNAAPPAKRGALLERYILASAARLLGLGPGSLHPQSSLRAFGLDSLNALRLKNRLGLELGLSVEPSYFLRDHSIAEMARELAELSPRASRSAMEEGTI